MGTGKAIGEKRKQAEVRRRFIAIVEADLDIHAIGEDVAHFTKKVVRPKSG